MLQMEKTKAAYYPEIYFQTTQTRFGALETDQKDLYNKPLQGKTILKVDALDCIKELWGNNILNCRELTYKLVSGNCSDEQYRKLLASYYGKYAAFCNYVDDVVLFGDKSVTLITRIIEPVRKRIDERIREIIEKIEASGGKVVMVTHDLVYATYRHDNLPEFEIMEVIK